MAKKISINEELLDNVKYDCIEVKGNIADLYNKIMDVAEEIYKLREKPMKKTALFSEHIMLLIEELKLKGE